MARVNPRFHALLQEIADLHDRKSHDYAQNADPLSNFRKAEAFGIPAWKGVLVRMSDKFSRIEELSNGKEAKNESLRDSLIDLAVYALIDVILLEELPEPRQPRGTYDDHQLNAELKQCSACGQSWYRTNSSPSESPLCFACQAK